MKTILPLLMLALLAFSACKHDENKVDLEQKEKELNIIGNWQYIKSVDKDNYTQMITEEYIEFVTKDLCRRVVYNEMETMPYSITTEYLQIGREVYDLVRLDNDELVLESGVQTTYLEKLEEE